MLAAPAAASTTPGETAQSSKALPEQQAQPLKVLRYAFLIAETTFDPPQITDLYSRTVVSSILDAPFEFAFLARPARMRPNTAAAMPEISDDFKTFTIRIRPGIYFADDPAFKGQPRELVAADYAYAIKRHYDPRWKSGNLYIFENAQILGLSELRKKLSTANQPFDYDAPVEGLRTLDRYTLQIKLGTPTPRFMYNFADGSVTGAVAREVVEAYGDKVGEHPVGTGPFVLTQWKRSSRIVLSKNPSYRERLLRRRRAAGRCAAAEGGARLQGQAAAADRPSGDIHHRRGATTLAELPQRRARPAGPTAGRLRHFRYSPTTSWHRTWPSAASRWCVTRAPTCRCRTSVWKTRWSADTLRTGWRCAAPSRWASTSTVRSASCVVARRSPARGRSVLKSGATTRPSKAR
jgi:hypothetical protein